MVFTSDFEPASVAALQHVHSDGLIEAVRSVDDQFSSGLHTVPRPLSPVLTERLFPESKPFGMTIVSAGTWRATTRAAGAVIAAIDKSVEAAKAEEPPVTAFCLVRPPGHHACVDGFDSVAGGCGFCVFNAVAVGAAHAIAVHGLKVAIVDFDVRHATPSHLSHTRRSRLPRRCPPP